MIPNGKIILLISWIPITFHLNEFNLRLQRQINRKYSIKNNTTQFPCRYIKIQCYFNGKIHRISDLKLQFDS